MCGGVTTEPRGPHDHPGPLGHRRVRVHRAARREPPRVELAPRGARLRPPRGARRSRGRSTGSKPVARRARVGGRRRRAERRGGRHHAELGRAPPPDVELRRHRPLRHAPAPRPRAASRSCRRRSPSTTGSTSSRATCSSCATSPPWRSSSSSARRAGARAAACTTRSTTPTSTRSSRATRSSSAASRRTCAGALKDALGQHPVGRPSAVARSPRRCWAIALWLLEHIALRASPRRSARARSPTS